MRYRSLSYMLLGAFAVAGLLFGCGTASKEGSGLSGTSPNSVGDIMCRQCHSAVMDPVTGQGIIAEYDSSSPHKDSAHANNGNGCEACHGGGAQHNGVGPIPYVNPFANNGTRCADCHAGKYATNAPTKFATSAHGKMTIETGGSCRRCHTNEGAILGAMSGLTGSKGVMDNSTYQLAVPAQKEFAAFECGTCHEHGGGLRTVNARDTSGNIVSWNPSKSFQKNDQFNFCTGCHTYKTYDGGTALASGNIVSYGTATLQTFQVGHHETSWYRVLATTHMNFSDNTASGANGITGYVIRIPKTADDAYASTTNPNARPCFDCHGHEWDVKTAFTNTLVSTGTHSYDPANETIWTEWAKSGHAGQILNVKMGAVNAVGGAADDRSATYVDAAMTAAVNEAIAPAWLHYDWSNGTADASKNRQACQRCHTATGASNFLNNPSTYDKTKNDFQHLASWSTTTPTSKQREMLYCWGCHANVEADKGGLRNPGAFTSIDYNFKGVKATFPDVGSSNVCVACHSGQASGETITAITSTFGNVSFKNSHYMAAAGVMYAKIGFTAFTDPSTPISTSGTNSTTYGSTLTTTEDGGSISSTHRKFGSSAIIGDHGITAADTQFTSGGPCLVCHMTKETGKDRHHTLEIDASAFNNVCIKCHSSEGGVTFTAATFGTGFLDEQYEVFENALLLSAATLSNRYHIAYDPANYPYFYDNDAGGAQVKNWNRTVTTPSGVLDDATAMKLMGACFNLNLLTKESAAFAHGRTYTRRLIYDTIDFLDNGVIDLSTIATAQAWDNVIYGATIPANANAATGSLKYLKGYDRKTAVWNAIDRP